MSFATVEFTPRRAKDAPFIHAWLKKLFAELRLSRRGKIVVELIESEKPFIRVTRRG